MRMATSFSKTIGSDNSLSFQEEKLFPEYTSRYTAHTLLITLHFVAPRAISHAHLRTARFSMSRQAEWHASRSSWYVSTIRWPSMVWPNKCEKLQNFDKP